MSSRRTMVLRSASVLVLASLVFAASGATLIGNLDGNDATHTSALGAARNKGMGFTLPAGTAYSLTSATLRLYIFDAQVSPIVQIFSNDASNRPGYLLRTLSNPAFPTTGIANYTFTPTFPFVFAPSTTYWLVVSGTAGSSAFDWEASSPGVTPTGIATHAGSYFDINGTPPTDATSVLNSYSITAQPVPEPATLAALGLGAVAMLRQRKQA